jgi:hypothetical protein
MKRSLWIVSALLLLATAPTSAEAERGLEKGDRLRVRTGGSSVMCTLQSVRSDTLFALSRDGASPIRIAVGEVRQIDVRVPRSKTRGMLWGALIGGGIMSTVGMVYAITTNDEANADFCGSNPIDEFCDTSLRAWRVVGYTFAFGAPGMLLGGIIGAAAPGERWEHIDLPGALTVRPRMDGTVLLEYTLSF